MQIGPVLRMRRQALARRLADIGPTNLFLLLLLAIILFYPLTFVGVTTSDDAILEIGWGDRDTWRHINEFVIEQGRFSFWWQYPLFQFAYVFDNRLWYLTVKLGACVLMLGALFYAVVRIFKSDWIALASLAFFLAFIQNGWDHNLLTAYPLIYNFLIALFLLSLGIFCTAVVKKSLPLACLSAALYFLTLATESFVLFFPLYIVLALSQGVPGESLRTRFMAGRRYLFVVGSALLVYLTIYAIWRGVYPSHYAGNQLNVTDLRAAAEVIAKYSLTALPLSSLHFLFSPEHQLRFADAAGFRSILQQANAVNFIKPVVTAFLFARLLISPRFVVPQARTLVIGAALAICSIFIPNALLGFTKKYQEWVVLYGSKSHLYTYHSFIAAVVAGALLLAYANAKSRLWRRTSRLAFLSAVMIALIIVSFAVEVRNEYVAFDQKLSRRKWELMDAVIASSEFSAIPNGANVVAPTLGEHYRGIAIVATGYWSKYVWYKTGKSINFLDDRCPKEAPCYLLVFRQKPHADRQFVAFAKATNSEVRSASEVTIYSMPIESGGALVGSLAPSSSPPELKIDGVPISNVNSELGEFSAELPPATDNGPVQIVKLAGNAAIFPEQVNFLEYGIEPHLRPYSAELAEGIDFTKRAYPHFLVRVSGMSGAEQWGRWTDAKLSRTAELEFRYPLPARFELEITAHGFGPNNALPAIVTVGAVTKKFISTPDWRIHHIHFETDGSARTIEITAPKPTSPSETDPRNNDTRQLGIALSSLRVRELRAGQ